MKKNELYILITAFVLSLLLFLVATKEGLLLTYDSRAYLKLAQDNSFKNSINAVWMPFYPFLLSFGKIFGENNILHFAKIFHLVCLLGIITQTFFITKKCIKTPILRYFVLFMVVFSVSNLQNAVFLWSESFFVVILLFSFMLLNQEIISNKTLSFLIILSVLLCFQRLAGIFFVWLFMAIIILKDIKKMGKKEIMLEDNDLLFGKYKIMTDILMQINWIMLKAFIYLFCSTSVIFLWFFLKERYQDTPQLAQNLIEGSFFTNISSCFVVMVEWFLPNFLLNSLPYSEKVMVSFFLILGMVATMIIVDIKTHNKLIFSILILVFGYISGICFLALNIPSETDRYISVVQILFFVGLGASLDFFWEKITLVFKRILLILMILTLSYNIIRISKNALFWAGTPQLLESPKPSKN